MDARQLAKRQKILARIREFTLMDADSGAGARRARYNSALMDADATVPKMDTDDLRETYVIFITASDVLGGGLPLYHIERTVQESGKLFDDGAHIIYVNGTYRGGKIGDLMHDFSCKKPEDMKNAILAEKVRHLKEDDKGVKHMCKIMEDFGKEEREEGKFETIATLLESGKMSEEEIAELYKLTDDQMKLVKEYISVLA